VKLGLARPEREGKGKGKTFETLKLEQASAGEYLSSALKSQGPLRTLTLFRFPAEASLARKLSSELLRPAEETHCEKNFRPSSLRRSGSRALKEWGQVEVEAAAARWVSQREAHAMTESTATEAKPPFLLFGHAIFPFVDVETTAIDLKGVQESKAKSENGTSRQGKTCKSCLAK